MDEEKYRKIYKILNIVGNISLISAITGFGLTVIGVALAFANGTITGLVVVVPFCFTAVTTVMGIVSKSSSIILNEKAKNKGINLNDNKTQQTLNKTIERKLSEEKVIMFPKQDDMENIEKPKVPFIERLSMRVEQILGLCEEEPDENQVKETNVISLQQNTNRRFLKPILVVFERGKSAIIKGISGKQNEGPARVLKYKRKGDK